MQTNPNLTIFINPAAGRGVWRRLQKEIDNFCLREGYNAEYFLTGDEFKTRKVLVEKEKQNVPFVFVIGGDGTINELARNMVGMNMALGILPAGSGNGLAHHLGITRKRSQLLSIVKSHKILEINHGLINDKFFFTTAGVGFDAEVGREFNARGRRGFIGYIWSFIIVLKNFETIPLSLIMNDRQEDHKVFSMTFANANQFGNRAKIAPGASIKDGFLDVVLVKPFPIYAVPGLIFRLFAGTIDRSRYVKTFPCTSISSSFQKPGNLHFDGEAGSHEGKVSLEIGNKLLRILVHKDYSEGRDNSIDQ